MRKYFKIRQNYEIIMDLKAIIFKTIILDRDCNPESKVVFFT